MDTITYFFILGVLIIVIGIVNRKAGIGKRLILIGALMLLINSIFYSPFFSDFLSGLKDGMI